jgi:hypothetical protein
MLTVVEVQVGCIKINVGVAALLFGLTINVFVLIHPTPFFTVIV